MRGLVPLAGVLSRALAEGTTRPRGEERQNKPACRNPTTSIAAARAPKVATPQRRRAA
jgi:hypothetical protein